MIGAEMRSAAWSKSLWRTHSPPREPPVGDPPTLLWMLSR